MADTIPGKQVINIGLQNESANSDSLFTAFHKIKDNFGTLFSQASPYLTFVGANGITTDANLATDTVTIGIGIVPNLTSSGNITAEYFIGNVIGNISGNIVVTGSNTAVLFNQLGNVGASDALKFDYAANSLSLLGDISMIQYTETAFVPAAGSAWTVSLDNGTVQRFTTNANTTITLPTAVLGKSYVIMVEYGGAHSVTFTGGTAIKWPNSSQPSSTSVAGKIDIYSFMCDTTTTYGRSGGSNF